MNKMFAITFAALVAVVILGLINDHWGEITRPLYEGDPRYRSAAFTSDALSLFHTGTFNWNERDTSPYGLRGPGYAIALASSFFLFGETWGAIYVVNLFFFLFSILILWRISIHFFSGNWAFLPPLMLALFWGFGAYVWTDSYELFVLFVALLSLKGFLNYYDTRSPLWLALGTIAYGLWILEKPIMLYSIPFVLFLLLVWHWRVFVKKERFSHAVVFLLVLSIVMGPWMIRNLVVLHTWQLGGGGHALAHRASQVNYSLSHLTAIALSFSVGDVIASKIHPSYPSDGKPAAWDPAIESRWYQQGWYITEPNGEVITRMELDRRLYREAVSDIINHPFGFFLSSPLGLLRLNAPVNLGAQETHHLLWGTRLLGSEYLTIAVLLAIRLAWFAFLGVVLLMLIRHIPLWRTQWGLILFFVLYFNLMYGLLTHAEARYIFTMMPLYFILFTEGVRFMVSVTSSQFPRNRQPNNTRYET